MKTRLILSITMLCVIGCRRAPTFEFPEVQKYSVTPGDQFFFRPSDGRFVLLDRRKALTIAAAPLRDFRASFEDGQITLARPNQTPRKPGDFVPPGGAGADIPTLEGNVLVPHVSTQTVLAFSADGEWLAGGDEAGNVTIWQVASGNQAVQVNQKGPVLSLAFSPDGKKLAAGLAPAAGSESVAVLDAANGVPLHTFGRLSASALAWSPDGGRLAVGLSDGSVLEWDAVNGGEPRAFSLSASPLVGLAFHPSGAILACAQADKRITIVRESTGERLYTFEPPLPPNPLFPRVIETLAFDPKGTRLAVAYADGDDRIWDTSSLR